MKIIIVGAGRIGRNLAKSLVEENHEVYLIEKNEERVKKLGDKLDIKVILGNGADPDMLLRAQVEQADLVIAVTTNDETNLVVCSLAASFGAKRRIARVRNTSLKETLSRSTENNYGIDEFINPELLASEAIVKTILTPGASEVADFAGGKILLRGFDVLDNSPLGGIKMEDLRDEDFPWPFLIVSIIRQGKVIIPKGDASIEKGDHIYVLLPAASLGEFLTYVNPDIHMPKKAVIYGATITGTQVAKKLSLTNINTIMIEENKQIAEEVATRLDRVTVINGPPTEADILTECGIEVADAYVATSNDDDANLISSVLAKKMGAKSTIITTQNPDYVTIINELRIDAIINPHLLAVKQILHLVRGRVISSVTKFMETDAEVLELVPEDEAPITKDLLKNIKFPRSAIVGAVCRGSQAMLANGETQIRPGDNVIVFCDKNSTNKIQQFFTG